MDCVYQLSFSERINIYALLMLKAKIKVFFFLNDEGSIWGFISLRVQGCFPKNVFWRKEESESAHCIGSILYKSFKYIPHTYLQQQATKGRIRWCTIVPPTPQPLLSLLYLQKTFLSPFLVGNSELRKVCMHMSTYVLKNWIRREYNWSTWP